MVERQGLKRVLVQKSDFELIIDAVKFGAAREGSKGFKQSAVFGPRRAAQSATNYLLILQDGG